MKSFDVKLTCNIADIKDSDRIIDVHMDNRDLTKQLADEGGVMIITGDSFIVCDADQLNKLLSHGDTSTFNVYKSFDEEDDED